MLSGFWEALGGKLGERGLAESLTPALIFFTGALAAWMWSRGATSGWHTVENWVRHEDTAVQIALAIAVLVGLIIATELMNRLTAPVLRMLEGYLPRPLAWLVERGAERRRQVRRELARRLQELSAKRVPTPAERAELDRIDVALHRMPADELRQMPTKLGDALRAAEDRPRDKYGLDPIICWPRLWLLLPEAPRTDLVATRESLNKATQVWIWGLLFIGFSAWAWWAAPMGIAVAIVAYYGWMLSAAETYGSLLESAFDIHRRKLYEELRWPLPQTPEQERDEGPLMMEYLWRGFTPTGFRFEGGQRLPR